MDRVSTEPVNINQFFMTGPSFATLYLQSGILIMGFVKFVFKIFLIVFGEIVDLNEKLSLYLSRFL
jgi:hypothetical protein